MNTLTTAARLTLTADTAADLMTAEPVSINAGANVREAIVLLHDRNIGAAPVIDAAGRAVGVISQADLLTHDREAVTAAVRAAETGGRFAYPATATEPLADPACVCDLMTPAVFSVTPDTPAATVVEHLLALNVHRVFVVTADGILVGVITTTDVLRHLTA